MTPASLRPYLEAAILALAVQTAVSLDAVGVATRVAASHILLPYFLAATAVYLLAGRRFRITIGWWWVAGFFAAAVLLMLNGLYVGAGHTGEMSGSGVRRAMTFWSVVAANLFRLSS